MGKRLNGKVAVVTGGGSGIGRGISLGLAAEGAQVVVNDLGVWTSNKPAGQQSADLVVDEIKKSGGKAVANYEDVSTMAGGQNIIKTAIDNFGRIDIVVCVAGTIKANVIEETSEEEWDRTMAVHTKGHFSCIKAAVPYMKRQKSGRIITFASRGAFGYGGSAAYSAAKAAIMGLTGNLSWDLGKYGITINCILPNAVTPLFPRPDKPAYGGLPAPKPAGPEMVAPMVVYLCTDEAQGINGDSFMSAVRTSVYTLGRDWR